MNATMTANGSAIFTRASLVSDLEFLASVVPARTFKPILECVRIEANGDTAEMRTTNLEQCAVAKVEQIQVESEMVVCLAIEPLLRAVKSMTGDVVKLSISGQRVTVKGSDSRFVFPTVDDSDIPPEPPEVDGETITVPPELFISAMTIASTWAADSVHTTGGVDLVSTKGKLTVVGCSEPRVVVSRFAGIDCKDAKAVVPAAAAKIIARMQQEESEEMVLQISAEAMSVSCGNWLLTTNLLEKKPPKYRDLFAFFETDKVVEARPSREEILSAVSAAEIVGDKIILSFFATGIQVKGEKAGSDYEANIPCKITGGAVNMKVRAAALREGLRALNSSEAIFRLSTDPRIPMTLTRPASAESEQEFHFGALES